MARLARVEIFAAGEVAIVHAMNCTVRRCFLLEDDSVTGKNFDHRKQWLEGSRFFWRNSSALICCVRRFFGTISI